MKRWNGTVGAHVDNANIDNYLADIIAVGVKHGLSLSHEDGHGAFEVQKRLAFNDRWLTMAHDSTDEPIPDDTPDP